MRVVWLICRVISPSPASQREVEEFHCSMYTSHLCKVSQDLQNEDEQNIDEEENSLYGLGQSTYGLSALSTQGQGGLVVREGPVTW